MKIEIRCGNFSEFDAALGRYVECGQKILVSANQVGETVKCPKCDQSVEVPYNIGSRAKLKSAVKTDKPNQRVRGASGTRQRKRSGAETPKATPQNQPQKRRRAAADMSRSDVMSMEFDEQQSSPLQEDRKPRCRKCGHVVKEGRCTACRFVEPTFEKVYQPLEDIKIELTGAQRWAHKTISQGVPVKALEYTLHIGLGILGAILGVLGILGLTGVGIGVVGGILLLLLIGAVGLLYAGLIYKGHQFLRSPKARLAWFQKPFWNLLLTLSRSMKWTGYDSQLKGRKIIKVSDPGFTDHNVDELEGLKACEVLDLEGTAVSDATLYKLYELKHLQVLILKRTNVSHDGVFRLQQSVPRLWVWY